MRRPGASLFFYDRKGWIAWRAMICPQKISEGKEKGKPAETGSPDKTGFEKQTFLKIFLLYSLIMQRNIASCMITS